jgi:hypothetical protein
LYLASVIKIELTRAEALVLFEWLSQRDEDPKSESAETRVFWKIEAALERTLVEPLRADYPDLLEDARREILRS